MLYAYILALMLLASLRDVWWDQPISNSLYTTAQFAFAVSNGYSYEKIHTASLARRDGLITTSTPRLKARAWCGDLCWNEPISLFQRCRMHIFSHSCCWLSLRDLWWDQPISHSPIRLHCSFSFYRFRQIFVRENTYCIVSTARWADLSTHHHIKPSPKGSGLMWWLVLRWAHLAFPTLSYACILELMLANVIPIFKKESKNNASNYRPISLLSSLSKVLEKAVHYHLYTYLNDHSLLTVKNSGFKPKDSTVNQLLSIVHKLYSGLDNKENACLVFLDISKAFDRVWHGGLLFKLKQLGISGTLLKWLESYLALRKQRVILDGCCSDVSYVEAGVPQGSILGPLLFLVYVNDLVTDLECDPHLFADDTSLLDIFTNPLTSSLKINRDLERIYKWGRLWRVNFNPIKTIFQIISKRKNVIYPNLIFDGVVIKRSIEHVHLGLTITSNLSWQRHIDKAILKANKLLYVMNNI